MNLSDFSCHGYEILKGTSKNSKLCATLPRQSAHLLRSFTLVSSAFASAASLFFGGFLEVFTIYGAVENLFFLGHCKRSPQKKSWSASGIFAY
jgi:hypothetical protein